MSFGRFMLGFLMTAGALTRGASDGSIAPSGEQILARVERETERRHFTLQEYSGSRQYTLQNRRFGSQAAVTVLMNYRQVDGEHYTVLARSGSEKLTGII